MSYELSMQVIHLGSIAQPTVVRHQEYILIQYAPSPATLPSAFGGDLRGKMLARLGLSC